MRKILFFGAPVFQIPVIEKAKEMGLHVGVVDIDPEAPAIPYADAYFRCSLKDTDSLLRIAETFRPDGILAGACDTSVVSVSRVCEKLGLPALPTEVAETATDKWKMLRAFERHGVPHPAFRLVRSAADVRTAQPIPFPAVSKPVDGSGSRGVAYISGEQDLKEAIGRSFAASGGGGILIEEYLSGPEVSVELVTVRGKSYVLQVTDKVTSGAPFFFETGHSQPSGLPEQTLMRVKAAAIEAVEAVGIVNGTAHVEIKITEDGPKLIELGARLGGGCISTYLLEATVKGVSLAELAVRIALGDEITVPSYEDSGEAAAVRFLLPEEGTLLSVDGADLAAQAPGVVKVLTFGKPGKLYSATTKNEDRIGFVVAEGKTREEAFLRCDHALTLTHARYQKRGRESETAKIVLTETRAEDYEAY